ncbi:MAG: hypothetical protein RLZZ568_2066, partial [Cyanobacteriota bacterium]
SGRVKLDVPILITRVLGDITIAFTSTLATKKVGNAHRVNHDESASLNQVDAYIEDPKPA